MLTAVFVCVCVRARARCDGIASIAAGKEDYSTSYIMHTNTQILSQATVGLCFSSAFPPMHGPGKAKLCTHRQIINTILWNSLASSVF